MTISHVNPFRRQRLLGALLAAAVLGLTACDTEQAPPFEVQDRGVLEGRLFLDSDGDGIFDPLAGDQPLTNVQLTVFERGTARQISGGQAVTDAQGRFRLENLPVGTHDVFVNPESLPTGVVCQNPMPVSVYRHEAAFLRVGARLACLIRIQDAKALPQGEVVNVRGVVTMAPGQGRTQGDDMYIQDASGGIKIFGAAALVGSGLQIGDLVDINGTMGIFNNEFQLISPVINERIDNVGAPAPVAVTTARVALQGSPPTAPDLGRLVRVERAQLLGAFSGGGGRNALINDGTGAAEIRIEPGVIGATADINPRFTVGACYNIVGVIGSFQGTAQLKPRQLNDIQEVPCN
jgi:hypothetical protein